MNLETAIRIKNILFTLLNNTSPDTLSTYEKRLYHDFISKFGLFNEKYHGVNGREQVKYCVSVWTNHLYQDTDTKDFVNWGIIIFPDSYEEFRYEKYHCMEVEDFYGNVEFNSFDFGFEVVDVVTNVIKFFNLDDTTPRINCINDAKMYDYEYDYYKDEVQSKNHDGRFDQHLSFLKTAKETLSNKDIAMKPCIVFGPNSPCGRW